MFVKKPALAMYFKRFYFFSAIVLLLAPLPASSGLFTILESNKPRFVDGETIYLWSASYLNEINTKRATVESIKFESYVAAIVDAESDYGYSPVYDQTTLMQVCLIVSKFLKDNPRNIHYSAATLVKMALAENFGRKKK